MFIRVRNGAIKDNKRTKLKGAPDGHVEIVWLYKKSYNNTTVNWNKLNLWRTGILTDIQI